MLRYGSIFPNGELIPAGESLRTGSDELMALPLWVFSPTDAPTILSERRRRNILQSDPEPTGDPEYS